MNEIEILRHIEWIIDKLKKSSTATYYLETDWETLPRIITLTEAINLRKELKKDFENRDPSTVPIIKEEGFIMANKKKKRITKCKRILSFSPYSYVEDCAKAVNMSGTEFLRKNTDWCRSRIHDFARGEIMTREMAKDLGQITGISAKTWQNLQTSYERADSHFHRKKVKKMKKFLKKPRKNQGEVAAGNLVRRYLELDSEIVRMLNGLDRKNFPAETKACSVVSGSLNDMYTELIDIMMNSTNGIEDDFETEFHDGVRNVETLETESEKVSEGIGVLREMAEGRHSYTEIMNAVEFTMIHALRILCVLQNTVGEIHR